MEDTDLVHTISGKDVIMAFGGTPKDYVTRDKSQGSRFCTCLFWSRYFLIGINILLWVAGLAIVGFGSWILVDGAGIRLFRHLFIVPGVILVVTGVVMVTLSICGWIGGIRLFVGCLRVYIGLVIAAFILQLATGAMAFFMLDHTEKDMAYSIRRAVEDYGHPVYAIRTDEQLDSLHKQFKCCGGYNLNDWQANPYYNCHSNISTQCSVPRSCCKAPRNQDCGHDVRDFPESYSSMYVYTDGCVPTIMEYIKEHIMIVAAIAFSSCLLEVITLLLAGLVIKYTVYHKTLLPE